MKRPKKYSVVSSRTLSSDAPDEYGTMPVLSVESTSLLTLSTKNETSYSDELFSIFKGTCIYICFIISGFRFMGKAIPGTQYFVMALVTSCLWFLLTVLEVVFLVRAKENQAKTKGFAMLTQSVAICVALCIWALCMDQHYIMTVKLLAILLGFLYAYTFCMLFLRNQPIHASSVESPMRFSIIQGARADASGDGIGLFVFTLVLLFFLQYSDLKNVHYPYFIVISSPVFFTAALLARSILRYQLTLRTKSLDNRSYSIHLFLLSLFFCFCHGVFLYHFILADVHMGRNLFQLHVDLTFGKGLPSIAPSELSQNDRFYGYMIFLTLAGGFQICMQLGQICFRRSKDNNNRRNAIENVNAI